MMPMRVDCRFAESANWLICLRNKLLAQAMKMPKRLIVILIILLQVMFDLSFDI